LTSNPIADVLAEFGFTWRTSLAGIVCKWQRWITNGQHWRRLAVAGWVD
jgi:hypothetical protein